MNTKREIIRHAAGCETWQLKRLTSSAQGGGHSVIAWLIQDWPIDKLEKTMLAFIAEKIWRDGHCRASLDAMLKELEPVTATWEIDVMRTEQKIYYAVWQLETRGLIKRTPRHKGYAGMSD